MSYKKQIFKLNDLKKFLTKENSCVFLIPTVRLLALPPFFLNDMKSGILYLLNNMLKKYDRSLGGIVIGYQNIKVLMDENTGVIPIGTSETEVNISVEFYIFQPRIGSYLEGVVNKKSNNHIGCLVHRYFNATILKADDTDYEDWICKDFNVDDIIIFKVKDLDFTCLLPYIEGVIDNEMLLDNNKYNMDKSCDTDSLMVNSLSKNSQKQILLDKNSLRHEITLYEKSDDDFFENKKMDNVKNKNAKSNTLEGNVNKNFEKVDSFTNLRHKKKKKDKGKKKLTVLVDAYCSKKEKGFSDTEDTSNTIIHNETDESTLSEKKKRKKKSGDINRDTQKDSAPVEDIIKVNSSDISHTVLKKLDDLAENKNSCDFVKPFKKRREKEKKNKEESSQILNKSSQCLSSSKMEDSVLYSTLIDPVQSEKMRISFCSPIPQGTPVGRKKGEVKRTEDSRVLLNSQNESHKNEKDKKQKKRKREEKESEDFPIPKKLKTAHSVLFKKKTKKDEMIHDEYKSDVQTMMEQLYNQQLNKIKEEINISDKDNGNVEKKKKKKLNNQRKEIIQNEVSDENKNTEVQINGREDVEKKCDAQNNRIETQVEESNILKQQSFKRKKRADVKLNKKKEICEKNMRENSLEVKTILNNRKNSVIEGEKKSEVQNILDGLLKQEMNRMKNNLENSETQRVEKKKGMEAMVSKQESLREGSHLSLYEKLLKEAKSAIEVDGVKLLNSLSVKQLKKNKNEKESDLSDFSTNSSKKKNLEKKKDNQKKTKIGHQTSDKYRNGSMYDTLTTPEKVNPDRSLFSDSEQSLTSPIKKKKEAYEIESNFGKSIVRNMLDEFCEEERKRLQSESDKESLISLKKQEKKKSKSEQKSQDSNGKKESLYEKLLREARSLIGSKEESPPKKKKKMMQDKKCRITLISI